MLRHTGVGRFIVVACLLIAIMVLQYRILGQLEAVQSTLSYTSHMVDNIREHEGIK